MTYIVHGIILSLNFDKKVFRGGPRAGGSMVDGVSLLLSEVLGGTIGKWVSYI